MRLSLPVQALLVSAALVAAVTALVSSQLRGSQSQPGAWSVRPAKDAGRVQVTVWDGDSSVGTTVDASVIEALAPGQLLREGQVQFAITRDAGSFTFEGVMRKGVGGGTFSFTADPAFAEGLARRGFSRPTALQQRALARADVGYAYLDELNAQE